MNKALQSFYESLRSEPELDQLVQDRREEDLYLEFKEKERRDRGELGDADKRAFSKAVSGFANADGGVLIFGIETRRSADGIDQAHALKPITAPGTFRSRLTDSVLATTQPVVDGVRVDVVPGQSGHGYVKCYIPASDKPPHRAMVAEREYWRRTSTGFRKMEHYELEDSFGRRLRPVLRLLLELRPRPEADPHEELHFFFLNEGRGIARHAGFVCRIDEGIVAGVRGGALVDLSALNRDQQTVSYYNPQVVIHANGLLNGLGHAIVQRPSKDSPLPIDVTWYAEEMSPRKQKVSVHPAVLVRLE
jgi:hypothetical protein